MSIRFKVILPYLLLTLIVAILGAYWVTNYLTDSLEERLHNQLVEAGRVVSDIFVQQNKKQVDNARLVYFMEGVREAIPAKDYATLSMLAKPAASGLKIENLLIFDQQGQEMLHLRCQGVEVFDVTRVGGANSMPVARSLLEGNDPNAFPRVEISQDTDGKWYYFTAIPIVFQGRMIGVAVAGASLETFMPYVRDAALANVVLYAPDGKAITSTLQSPGDENIYLATLSLSPGIYEQIAEADKLVIGENFEFDNKRSYSVARGVLQVGNDRLGVFAVVLPADFVTQFASDNRNQYILIFSIATIFVVALGFYIANRITTPLSSLVRTSEVIAGGNLSKRTGLRSGDEIGTLAQSFDEMTEHLQQRTADLEKSTVSWRKWIAPRPISSTSRPMNCEPR